MSLELEEFTTNEEDLFQGGDPGQGEDLLAPEGGDLVREGKFLVENAYFAINEEYSEKATKEGEEKKSLAFLYLEGPFGEDDEQITVTFSLGQRWQPASDGKSVQHPEGHKRFHATTGAGKMLKKNEEEVRASCIERGFHNIFATYAATYVGLELMLGEDEYKKKDGQLGKRTGVVAVLGTNHDAFKAYRAGSKATQAAQGKKAEEKKKDADKPAETKKAESKPAANGGTKATDKPKATGGDAESVVYEIAKKHETFQFFRKEALAHPKVVADNALVKQICQETYFDDLRAKWAVEQANAADS